MYLVSWDIPNIGLAAWLVISGKHVCACVWFGSTCTTFHHQTLLFKAAHAVGHHDKLVPPPALRRAGRLEKKNSKNLRLGNYWGAFGGYVCSGIDYLTG